MNGIQLHCVTVSGTPAIMGEMLGESLRDSIAGLVDHRLNNAATVAVAPDAQASVGPTPRSHDFILIKPG